jgi:exodeoxyribonuclease VII small subunit
MTANKKAEQPSFESLLGELEQLVARLEDETVSLDEAMELHSKATKLVKVCQERLSSAEQQIQKLIQDAQGNWQTEDLV